MSSNEKRFDPQKRHGLLSEERKARWDPLSFLKRFNLQSGQSVLDLGCGPGFWTLPLADIVGPTGIVWALDVSPDMLNTLLKQQPPSHVIPVLGELPQIELETAITDFIWAAFVYHEVEKGLADEMWRVSCHGGHVAILEWRPDATDQSGPPVHHRIWPNDVKKALKQAGFGQAITSWQDANAYLITAYKEHTHDQ